MRIAGFIVLVGTTFLAIVHPTGAADRPWSMAQERYSCTTSGMTLQELASGGVTVVSHTPSTKQYCEEAHRWGIKVCPYVSLYKVMDSSKDKSLIDDPFWNAVDAAKHPEWYLRREDGQIRRPFDEANYEVNMQQSCCNHRDLIAAYERGVRNLMDMGAGGVFVDNVHPNPKCFGPKLGLHSHDWPEKDNVDCYKMALRRVYDAVKSYGKDRVVVLNPGGPDANYVSYGDSIMWESFIWRFAFDGDKPPPVKARRWEPRSWKDLLTAYTSWRPSVEKGASIAPLTYLPDAASDAENAFFAYAVARVAGFDQWTGTGARRDILRRLYRVQTGAAISQLVEAGDAAYRQFQNALVVCNHSLQMVEVRAPLPPALRTAAVELFEVRELPVTDGHVVLSLPAESGRVIVARADAVDNLLREVAGQAIAARLHIEEKDAGGKDASTAALRKQLQDIESHAAALRKNVREVAFPTAADRAALATLSKAAAAASPSLPSDAFLAERLDNMHRHADLAARLVAEKGKGP